MPENHVLQQPFSDIHCHLLPGLDDGAGTWEESLEMARLAVADGIMNVVVTPHQLGAYQHIGADQIRHRTRQLQEQLRDREIPLTVFPGADVRVDPELVDGLERGDVLTLADRGRHVLLELPDELFMPLESLIHDLGRRGIQPILAQPERNLGIQRQPRVVEALVEEGCLLQVTAGSLLGGFGNRSRELAEWLVVERLAHLVATDAHGRRARRPLMQRAFQRIAQLTDLAYARAACWTNPNCVLDGQHVRLAERPRRNRLSRWMPWKRAG